ncbi:H-type lectin domain protein (macronuclear) [Tetrahymena thermophila SB210]|uniref:H-type lectin domain protein n=1 Tax=Tetrahymena thermophila (strain SB210) TaxID=312017 RepID=I7M6V1_TETTS|nr:H-type lectin domain protein [Tetrahymena thermophila SB210]EAR87313.2 H-type lectin domain protein [Tetrahymena thermophila SB210]|eukprot:XP_001007558.2 H-type lectin domain protein [Tetrahymena thermophila SB210]
MRLIYKLTTFFILIRLSYLKQISIVDSNFSKTGNFILTNQNPSINVSFESKFSSIPQVIISQSYLDSSKNTNELDYQVQLSAIDQTGFQAVLIYSQNSQVFQVDYNYIATIGSNIYSISKSIDINSMNQSSDANYQIYSAFIPFSKNNLPNNPKIYAKAIGFMTGFYIKFNYFEFYYQDNNSIMMNMYQETSYEFILDSSNCLYNNVISNQYQSLNQECKKGLSGDDILKKFARVQTSKTPINVQHITKQDFAIGFSKMSCNLSAQNPRIVLYDFALSSNTIQITYYTWQGSQVLGVTSTIIELYSLSCPTGFFYSFAASDCVNSCEQQTYQEQNLSNNSLLPTCNQCNTTCFDCTGPLSNNCKSCSVNFPYFNTITNECLQQKPISGYFCIQSKDISYQFNCQPCKDIYCNNCTDIIPNSCSQCQPNTYLYNNSCQQTKPSPAFCDSQNICQKCSIQYCLSCDQGPQTCSQCPSSFYIDQNTNQCKCPYATFLDSNNPQCIPCPINCAICQSSIYCQVCASDSLKDPLNPGKFASNVLHNALLVLNLNLIVNHVKLVLKQNLILCLIKMNALVLIRKIHKIKQLVIVSNVKILCASSVISIIEISVYNAYNKHNFHKLIRNVCVLNLPITHKVPIVAFNVLKQIVWNVYLMALSAFNVKVGSFLITGTILVAFANQSAVLQLGFLIYKQIAVHASLLLQKPINRIANLVQALTFYSKLQVQ